MEIYRIDEIKKCCDNIRIFRLSPVRGKIDYKAGHFLMLHIIDKDGNSLDKRPYSIASSPTQEYIELAIKMVNGRFTSKLEELEEESLVGVEGPYGSFTYHDQEKCAFIAGGTGVAPFIGILRYIDAERKKGNFVLFYSCRKKEDILYYEELMKLTENSGITVVFFLTREEPREWKGELGRVNSERIRRYVPDALEYDWYICGPAKMTLSMKDMLIQLGVSEDKMRLEGWG